MSERFVAFVLADLAGYTALTEAHGGPEAAEIVYRYHALVDAALAPGARVVERVGDEVLVVTDSPSSAVRRALALREAVEREPLFPAVRMGLHAGLVVEREGRHFGPAINLVARVAAHARGGQILCTEAVATAAPLDGVAYEPLGEVRFKNVVSQVALHEVRPRAGEGGRTVVDPVCRMQIQRGTARASLSLGAATHHFCSLDCARAFAANPELYSA